MAARLCIELDGAGDVDPEPADAWILHEPRSELVQLKDGDDMGSLTLNNLAASLLSLTTACTGSTMIKSNTEFMSFTQDTIGATRPSQPTSVILDDEVAYLLIRKSARNTDTGTGYLGIGEYALPASPDLKLKFYLLAKTLSSQLLPPPKPALHQSIIRYDFDLAGKRYSGVYDLSLGQEFNAKLKPFGEIKSKILERGSPRIGFRPEVRAQAVGGEVLISLEMINTGQIPLELVGPSGWSRDVGPTEASVTVGVSTDDQDGWVFRLDSEHLVEEDGDHSDFISISQGRSVTLKFRYPMSVPGGFSRKYVVAARMKAIVLAPKKFEGLIETGLDEGFLAY